MAAALLPPTVAAAIAGPAGRARILVRHDLRAGTGAATGSVTRLTVEIETTDGPAEATMVRKRLAPLSAGRHAAGTNDPRHWAYWRLEAEAYAAGILPAGVDLRAPRCFGVVGDDIYLEDVAGDRPSAERAVQGLAGWTARAVTIEDRPWIGRDQLRARLAVTDLDWSAVDGDARVRRVWERHDDLAARLARLPRILAHGDFSIGNLLAPDGCDLVAIDWATLGWEPVGFDLAHLALGTGVDLCASFLAADVERPGTAGQWREGFAATVALVGASRYHWMLARDQEPPEWLAEFVADQGCG